MARSASSRSREQASEGRTTTTVITAAADNNNDNNNKTTPICHCCRAAKLKECSAKYQQKIATGCRKQTPIICNLNIAGLNSGRQDIHHNITNQLTQVVVGDVHAVQQVLLELGLSLGVELRQAGKPSPVHLVLPAATTAAPPTLPPGILGSVVRTLTGHGHVSPLKGHGYSRVPLKRLLEPVSYGPGGGGSGDV